MYNHGMHYIIIGVLLGLLGSTTGAADTLAGNGEKKPLTPAEEGKQIAFDRTKGNCLACHAIEGGTEPGNVGPALVGIKDRYPDTAKLKAQIWDATAANLDTCMPPFGTHRILSAEEIDKVVEFVHSL